MFNFNFKFKIMAERNVLKPQPASTGGAPRHGFELGQDFTFTASLGMLLPTYKCFVNVGEKISGAPRFFLRTEQLLAPVMGDVDVFVDCFFVPMRHLYSPFEQFMMQIDDNASDMFDFEEILNDRIPVINSGSSPFDFFDSFLFLRQNLAGCYLGFDLHRLMFHLGYNPQSLFHSIKSDSLISDANKAFLLDYEPVLRNVDAPNPPAYMFAAYQKIYMDFYRDTEFEPNKVKAYNFDSAYSTGNVEVTSSNGRLEMFRLRYRNKKKDYFTAVHPNPLGSGIGMIQNVQDSLRMMNNWLTSEPVQITQSSSSDPNYNGLSVGWFNRINGDGSIGSDFGRWTDSTGSSIPSGDVSTNPIVNTLTISGVDNIKHDHSLDISNLTSLFQISTLRSAFAFEKLWKVTARAGKHVDDQVLAHFGFKMPQGVSNEVYLLKQYHTLIHFGEVTSTAATETADLGQLAGKGYAGLDGKDGFSFTAPCPGVFMCIFSAAPRYKYLGAVENDGYKVYLPNFFKPAIDNLGPQPLFAFETGYSSFGDGNSRRLWVNRWQEDKVKFDKAAPVFATAGKNPWTFAYVAPSLGDSFTTTAYEDAFKVSPYDLNNVLVSQYNGMPAYPKNTDDPDHYANFCKSYLTDPFTIDFSMNFTRVSQMSIYGDTPLGGI